MFKCALVLLVSIYLLMGCATQSSRQKPAQGVSYYSSFAGYHVPYRLVGPLSQEEAVQQVSYYMGWHDEAGQLTRVEKYFDGKRVFRVDYLYHDNGELKQAISQRENGETATRLYDRKGKTIR